MPEKVKQGILFFVLFFLSSSLCWSKGVDFKLQCKTGDVQACLSLEGEAINQNSGYYYLNYTYKLCKIGEHSSCLHFQKIASKMLVSGVITLLLLIFSLKVRINRNDHVSVFLIKTFALMYIFFFGGKDVLFFLISFCFNLSSIEAMSYTILMLIILVLVFIKSYQLSICSKISYKSDRYNAFLFVIASVLILFISIDIGIRRHDLIVNVSPMSSSILKEDIFFIFKSVFLSPIFEELFFKVFILGYFSIYLKRDIVSIVLTTLIFLFLHGDFYKEILISGNALLSFYFFYKTRNLLIVTFSHMFNNAILGFMHRFPFTQDVIEEAVLNHRGIMPVLALVGLAFMTIIMLSLLIKSLRGFELRNG